MSAVHFVFGIYLSRGGMPPGPPISVESAKRSVAEGQLSTDQLAWCRGLADWRPLEEVIQYVEKKTSTLLAAIPESSQPSPRAAPTLAESAAERVGLSPSRHKESAVRPLAQPTRIPSWTRLQAMAGLGSVHLQPGRKAKEGEVNSDELGEKLWAFAKQLTRDFRLMLGERFKETNVAVPEEQEFNFSQELLVFHLWLISKVVDALPKAADAMNRRYVLRQSEIAESYEHHWQRVEFIRSVKETFSIRFNTYQNAWNYHSPKAQTIAAACLLKNLLGSHSHYSKPVENLLVSYINSYLTKLPRTVAGYVEQYRVID